MRPTHIVAAASLIVALPTAALANPAQALSLTRAAAFTDADSRLGEEIGLDGVWLPLLGLTAVAVLIMVLADEKVDAEDESVSAG